MMKYCQICVLMGQHGYSKKDQAEFKKYRRHDHKISDKVKDLIEKKVPIIELKKAVEEDISDGWPWLFCKFEPDVDY